MVIALGLLYVPDCEGEVKPAEGVPFEWDQDALWAQLQRRFDRARAQGCHASISTAERIQSLGQRVRSLPEPLDPDASELEDIERDFFEIAADVAACPSLAPRLITLYAETRATLKDRSRAWSMSERPARNRLYRMLYGSRMAIEEVLLQMEPDAMPTLIAGRDEPSASPSIEIRGVQVHSGDILVSRGGATTSAFIARGNDYPGNFSHVALVHVDEDGTFQTIEAHIEIGVAVAGLETYEADPKLRVMLLRPRADLGEGAFAHRAATKALERAQSEHIAYDFAMDFEDDATLFCSEVASQAYRTEDIELWKGMTSMSSEGTARWLHAFGVRHFVTHGPSDLEYDPQLVVVAEWRNAETLWQDHLDNAILDALLEGAAQGDDVSHSRAMLPIARILKGWSWVKNRFGAAGPIPEGMSATVALRVEWLRERHRRIKADVEAAANAFRDEHGYRPPYWELVRLANEARESTGNTG